MTQKYLIFEEILSKIQLHTIPLLSENSGFSAVISDSSILKMTIDGQALSSMSIQIFGKNTDQFALANELSSAWERLVLAQNLSYCIQKIKLSSPPFFFKKIEDFYLWKMVIYVEFVDSFS